MKKVSIITALTAALFCIPVLAQDTSEGIKIAVIDMQRVILESSLGKAMQGRVQEYVRSKTGELQQEQQALQREQADLENQRSVLSAEAYTNRRNDLEQRALAFRQRSEAADREYQRIYQEEMKKFIAQAAPVIEIIGQENNFTLVFDRNDQGLLFFDRTLDITDMVLQRLDTATQGQ